MTLEEQCRLSYYKKIADISTHTNVSLVQHVESMRIFVKKEQTVYNKQIYEYLMQCNNPHVPKIYECVEDEDKLIIIEEYIHGESLAARLAQVGVYSEAEVCQLMITICDVLEQLHYLPVPVIHRDLKPENILVQENGYVKIIDFNTAKQYEEGRGQDTIIMGTREYAAPEQYGFKQSDARTDIYAMGVMMNYLLTREYPRIFVYLEKSKKLERMTYIIRKCTAFDPEERYQNVMELRKDLQAVLEKKQGVGELEKVLRTQKGKRSFAPPGFRTRTFWKMLLGSVGYIFIFWLGFTIEITDSAGNPAIGYELWAYRIIVLVWLLLTVAFCANYMGLQKLFPMPKKPYLKWLGCAGWSFVFFFLLIMMLSMVVG